MISDLIEKAKGLGFISLGVSRAETPPFFDQFSKWICAGRHGEMSWLERHMEIRQHPRRLLEGCNSIISLVYPYTKIKPCTPDGFTIARYSEPKKNDYHRRLRQMCLALAESISERYPKTNSRICIDSAPLLERSFAYASGIGFIGKNNSLIIPGYGSYFFLAEILTTAPLPAYETSPMENLCGQCKSCIEACPSGALEAPFNLDAAKCLSYLTIEHKGPTDRSVAMKMGRCFIGCDICQEVCPYNHVNAQAESEEIMLPSTEEILNMDDRQFSDTFGDTALSRPGLCKIKQNILAIRSLPSRDPGQEKTIY
ncbi:putative iron-sulfur cluster-binding protein [uncultured Desulfobacterium sp.]|uniref:Putative iron-sulfur cluster-binding protein n=1 Tax=uncultured Desulfobacterium sp. TaxID=201089 RepID=A0A445N2J6_9BACT|nr:putative iron-sulfur cluster-binding protein [uncultured Desulfobacterium sp.]